MVKTKTVIPAKAEVVAEHAIGLIFAAASAFGNARFYGSNPTYMCAGIFSSSNFL
jgi:hypothetical protein